MVIGGAEKITSEHLARLACPYVRQSTPHQVRNNAESRELQYELKGRAIALGWPAERIRVIDTDLGQACAADETALSWSQQGLRGTTGTQGPAGMRGPSGPEGRRARKAKSARDRPRHGSHTISRAPPTSPAGWISSSSCFRPAAT